MASFLEIANNVAIKVRLPEMTNCYSSSERNAKVIKKSIIDGAERDVFRAFDWSKLVNQDTITTQDSVWYYDLADGYHRSIQGSFWNNTSQRQIVGPVDSQTWAMYQNDAFGVSAIDYVCSIRELGFPSVSGLKFALIPTPSGEETITYYYVSDRYVVLTNGTYASEFVSDEDQTVLDDELVEQAALCRTLRILGLDYGEERVEFEKMLRERMSHDGGARTLDMSRPSGRITYTADMVLGANVPLTGLGE